MKNFHNICIRIEFYHHNNFLFELSQINGIEFECVHARLKTHTHTGTHIDRYSYMNINKKQSNSRRTAVIHSS